MFSGRNQVQRVDGACCIFSPRADRVFSGWPFCIWLTFFLYLAAVSQCLLLNATYGWSLSKGVVSTWSGASFAAVIIA